jgi:hypothetical protein
MSWSQCCGSVNISFVSGSSVPWICNPELRSYLEGQIIMNPFGAGSYLDIFVALKKICSYKILHFLFENFFECNYGSTGYDAQHCLQVSH